MIHIYNFKKNKYFFTISFIQKRLENFLLFKLDNLANYSIIVFFFYFNSFSSEINSSNKKKFLLNIYFLDLLSTYKGWRHLKGLPVRGQRTWTNSITSFNSNIVLKNYKISLLKKVMNTNNMININNYLLLEYTNLLWKLQWTNEWFELKKRRLHLLKKKSKNLKIKIDENSINLELLSLRLKFLKKKSKSAVKNSYVSLGFEPGFSSITIK